MSDIDGIPSDSSEKVSQVRRRFNRIAPDFDRAVIAAQFSPSQAALIQQAREQAWVKASLDKSEEAYPFKLNVSALARRLRFARGWFAEQHASLVVSRVFVPRTDGQFDLNKDYRKWVDAKGRPRLDREMVEWCLEALSLWKEAGELSGKPDKKVSGKPDRGCLENQTPPPTPPL